jgi:cytochrome c oxidase subunit 2
MLIKLLLKKAGLIPLIMMGALFVNFAKSEPLVQSQEELLHQKNNREGDKQVHAVGAKADPNLSFTEKYGPPRNFTSFSHPIDWLFRYVSWTGFGFFMLMFGSIIYFLIAYRAREGHKATYLLGTSRGNKIVTIIFVGAVFVSMDLMLDYHSVKSTKGFIWNYPSESESVRIMVMPQQWAWNFKYAGEDGKFGTTDDIDTLNEMRVPKGRKILLQIKSKDVIHGFFIPQVRLQVDALPGVITRFWFDANTVGDYEIACYHHCGTSHYKMKAFLKVVEENDFNNWVVENSRWSVAKHDPNDKQVAWGWNWTSDLKN